MKRNFDEARKVREDADRSFQIGGETFVYRPAVAPEAIMAWSEFAGGADAEQAQMRAAQANLAAVYAQQRAAEAAEADAAELARISVEVATKTADVAVATAAVEAKTRSDSDWLVVIDDTIDAILEPEYQEAWKRVRDPDLSHPLSLGDLQEVLEWLIEEVVKRPTGKPSDSSPSDGTIATVSTVDSSSPAAPASEA